MPGRTNSWPYGVARNRIALESLARYAFEQGLTDRALRLDELFAPTFLEREIMQSTTTGVCRLLSNRPIIRCFARRKRSRRRSRRKDPYPRSGQDIFARRDAGRCTQGHRSRRQGRRIHLHRRALRLRQDHAAADPRRARGPFAGRSHHQSATILQLRSASMIFQESLDLSLDDDPQECRLWVEAEGPSGRRN